MNSRSRRQPLPFQRTKLHRPPVPPDVVRREELLELMAAAAQTPATLVCAPAGYGKSVLVSEWLEEAQPDHAWLSLGEAERDLRLFLTYVLAGIEDVAPGACQETSSLVEAPELPPVSTIARTLGNELESLRSPLFLVLDDYHVLAPTSPVHDLLNSLLEYPARHLRVVFTARHDPPLELTKLRAAARLTEIRTHDLRFTPAHTAELIRKSAGLEVGPAALENLHGGVEGWAVGLRLVLAALRHVRHADDLLLGLRGGLASIQEYLLREVLSALPAELRRLAEVSALFERFCPELLEAVLSPDGGEETSDLVTRFWELTDQGHLFVILLDAERRWKRYHHQLRDLLRVELDRELADAETTTLHLRASAWFEQAGEIDEALDHALAADDPGLAAAIIGRHSHTIHERGGANVLERWLDRLPPGLEDELPHLMVARVMTLVERHQLFAAESLAQKADSLLDDPEADPSLRAELDVRLGLLDVYLRCDARTGLQRLERASRHLPDSSQVRGQHRIYLSVARQMLGEGNSAMRALAEEIRSVGPSEADLIPRLVGAQALVGLLQGDLAAVSRSALRFLDRVQGSGRLTLEGWAHYFDGAARFHRGEVEEAARALERVAARPYLLQRRVVLDAMAVAALCHARLARVECVDAILEKLEELTRQSEPHHVDVVDSCRARLQLQAGDLTPALAWARSFERDVHPSSLFHSMEVPVITQIRVWVMAGQRSDLAQALARVDEVRAVATAHHFACQLNDLDVLQAAALAKMGQRDEALEIVAAWLDRALPQRWIQPLTEVGPTVIDLIDDLRQKHRDARRRAELDRLLASLDQAVGAGEDRSASRSGRSRGEAADVDLLLTPRELDVLELLVDRLQDKEIAGHLGVSRHTVKDHLKRIYQKLGVGNRRQAAARAVSEGLVDRAVGRGPGSRA